MVVKGETAATVYFSFIVSVNVYERMLGKNVMPFNLHCNPDEREREKRKVTRRDSLRDSLRSRLHAEQRVAGATVTAVGTSVRLYFVPRRLSSLPPA